MNHRSLCPFLIIYPWHHFDFLRVFAKIFEPQGITGTFITGMLITGITCTLITGTTGTLITGITGTLITGIAGTLITGGKIYIYIAWVCAIDTPAVTTCRR
jgi:hypothetical protein